MSRLTAAAFALGLILYVGYFTWNIVPEFLNHAFGPRIETRLAPEGGICVYDPSPCPVNR